MLYHFAVLILFMLLQHALATPLCEGDASEGCTKPALRYTNWLEEPTSLLERRIHLGRISAVVEAYNANKGEHYLVYEDETLPLWVDLKEKEFSIDGEERFFWTPKVVERFQGTTAKARLLRACWAGDVREIQEIFEKTIMKATVKYDYGESPLHWAADWDDVAMVEVFVENGANVDERNDFMETPLHIAAQRGNTDLAERLVSLGADTTLEDRYGRTPVMWAAVNGHEDTQIKLEELAPNFSELYEDFAAFEAEEDDEL
jgi:hypothetical protein